MTSRGKWIEIEHGEDRDWTPEESAIVEQCLPKPGEFRHVSNTPDGNGGYEQIGYVTDEEGSATWENRPRET